MVSHSFNGDGPGGVGCLCNRQPQLRYIMLPLAAIQMALEALLKSGGNPNELVAGGGDPSHDRIGRRAYPGRANLDQKPAPNVNHKNQLGRTALMFATRYGFESIVTALIDGYSCLCCLHERT